MKRTVIYLLTAALLLSVSGCKKKEVETQAPVDVKQGTNVSIYSVQNEAVSSSVSYTGEIMSSEDVSVSAKASGKALAVNAEIGQYVTQGTVLLTIDSTDYKLQYNQAEAAYNSAVAAYNSATGGAQQQARNNLQNTITSAETEYNNALSNYNREKEMYESNTNLISVRNQMQMAKNQYDRTSSLYEMGAVSKIELDNAKIAYENAEASVRATENSLKAGIEAAKARLDNAQNNLNAAKKNYDLTVNVLQPESEATAQAQVDSCKAALELARNALNNTTLTAPISGYISGKNISKGEFVAPGTPLFTISDTKDVEGEIKVTESVIPFVKVGTEANISVKAAGISDIKGTVSVLNNVKDAASGLYTVRVRIPNSNSDLKVGMFADITLITQTKQSAVTVPNAAIMQSGEEKYVWIADEAANTAQKRTVVTGIDAGDKTEIVSGVSAGEAVVVSGKEYLSDENNQINITDRE